MANSQKTVTNITVHLTQMLEKYKERVEECYTTSQNKRTSAYTRKEAHNYMWLYQGKVDTIQTLLDNICRGQYNDETFIKNVLNK
jgi:hypothetical protein